jgi:subtilisin family serine protease
MYRRVGFYSLLLCCSAVNLLAQTTKLGAVKFQLAAEKQRALSPHQTFLSSVAEPATPKNLSLIARGKNKTFSEGDVRKIRAQVQSLGGAISLALKNLLIISVPSDRLELLENIEELGSVELSPPDMPLSMNVSRSNQQSVGIWLGTNADSAHALGYTGVNALVGIVDLGFDIYNEDFKNSDNTTRVLAAWNQSATGTPPSGFTYGAEYDSAAINAVISFPNDGHGTACLGIAAGNGRASGQKGIAPEAGIILVKAANLVDTSVIAAFTYIKQKAQALGLPVSIGYSYGSNFGAHDGSRSTEVAISSLAGAGTLFSVAAGNNGGQNIHVTGVVAPSSFDDIGINRPTTNQFFGQLWYRGADEFTLSLIAPDATVYGPFPISGSVQSAAGGNIQVFHNTFVPNGDRQIQFTISNLLTGNWTARLNAVTIAGGANAGKYDGWKISGDGNWTTRLSGEKDLTTPSTADSALSIAAYEISNGTLASFSSRGLTRNDRPKPELAAPTNVITTNGSFGGTSASAPHLAGLGAILLQANPNLSTSQFRQAVADSSRKDAATGTIPPHRNDWGYGKLYALGALQAVLPRSGTTVNINRTGNYIWRDDAGYAVMLNFASEDISTVQVTVFPDTPPPFAGASKAVKRYASITATGGTNFNATLRLYYDDAEVAAGGLTEGNLRLYRYNGSAWEFRGGTNNTLENYVELAGVTEFSLWAIADPSDTPLLVELSEFRGQTTEAGVELVWKTASERNNAGFEVQRRTENDKQNEAFQTIASYRFDQRLRGNGTTTRPTTYSFLDMGVEADKTYAYKLRSYDLDGVVHDYPQTVVVSLVEQKKSKPLAFELFQNYPNPFNPSTVISYQVPVSSAVRLKVYDVLGREVATLVNQRQEAGRYEVRFNAAGLASGVYLYQLSAAGLTQTRKMMIAK